MKPAKPPRPKKEKKVPSHPLQRNSLSNPLQEPVLLQTLIDTSPDMIFIVDYDTMRYLYVNETACRLGGYTQEEYARIRPYDTLMMSAEELKARYDEIIAAGPEGTTSERRVKLKDGGRSILEFHNRALKIKDRWAIIVTARDISRRFLNEESIQRLSRMFAALSAINEAIMRARSSDELFLRICDAAVEEGKLLTAAVYLPDPSQTGLKLAVAAGRVVSDLDPNPTFTDTFESERQDPVRFAFQNCYPATSEGYLDIKNQTDMEGNKPLKVINAAVPLVRGGRALGVLFFRSLERRAFNNEEIKLLERIADNILYAQEAFERDLERKRAEERIQYLATHDALTGLPNRMLFGQLLNHAIQAAKRFKRQFAVLFIDLDRFKIINDTLGHDSGDQLLQEVAGRLHRVLREIDIVARLGGDEFVVLIEEVKDPSLAGKVAEKILSVIIKPVILKRQEYRITASIGICVYPRDAEDENTLMRNADIAMYMAKEEGKNTFQFFSRHMKVQSVERLTIETHLRGALEREELSLEYQAKLDLKSGIINGVEALLRWNNPVLGSVSPTRFIPVAEEIGLIIPFGRWVLNMACNQNVAWQRQGLPRVSMAVNLSVRQIMDDSLVPDINTALEESGLEPQLLELEITESMLIQNPERVIKVLNEVKKLGVRLAIDDFGTGYSSLAQIKRFPVDTLKVDRSFIRDLAQNPEDRAITEAIIAMGKTLSLTVVAEGVETKEQEALLRKQSCDEMQGFYFSKPVPPERFAELLRRSKSSDPEY